MLRRLKGAPLAKERALIILENLGGGLPVGEACRRMDVSPALFHRQRMSFLEGGLVMLEPRPRGRPGRVGIPQDRRIRELEAKVERLEVDLAYTRVREELALLIPWTRRTEKGSRRFHRPFWRANTRSRSLATGGDTGNPGSGSPIGLGSAPELSSPGADVNTLAGRSAAPSPTSIPATLNS
jgi:hypothetical protein